MSEKVMMSQKCLQKLQCLKKVYKTYDISKSDVVSRCDNVSKLSQCLKKGCIECDRGVVVVVVVGAHLFSRVNIYEIGAKRPKS